jgi:hypothetical protein
MVLIAIVNGTARDLGYRTSLGELRAHQVSTLTAIALFGLYIWFALRRLRPASTRAALAGGALWMAMTVAFEFLFGHYVAGKPWPQLMENYNLAAGHWWPLILVWVCVTPPLFHRLQR